MEVRDTSVLCVVGDEALPYRNGVRVAFRCLEVDSDEVRVEINEDGEPREAPAIR